MLRLGSCITFSIQYNHFNRILCGKGPVSLFLLQSHEGHTTMSSCKYRTMSERSNSEQVLLFQNINTYVTRQRYTMTNAIILSHRNKTDNKLDKQVKGYSTNNSGYDSGGRSRSRRVDHQIDRNQYDEEEKEQQSSGIPDDESEDTFGNLSRHINKTLPSWVQEDQFCQPLEQEKPHRRLAVEGRRHPQDWYFKQIIAMGKEGKVLKAIAVLDDWMLVRDRVMPNEDIYTAVIGIIGRTGNATLAFKYFNKMKEYGLQPNEATFTALFNACANCPDKKTALKKGYTLRRYMQRLDIIPNIITYNAIIKMYGRLGDLRNAFLVADEAISNRRAVDCFFFGSLLSAAISDKEEGLLFAIEIWRKMKIMRVQPDVFHYKLMLQAIKECKLGSLEQQRILLQSYVPHRKLQEKQQQTGASQITTQQTRPQQHSRGKCYGELQQVQPQKSHESLQQIKQTAEESHLEQHKGPVPETVSLSLVSEDTTLPSVELVSSPERPSTVEKIPDLLNPQDSLSEVVSLGDMSDSEDRLLLMGGVGGFLDRMKADSVKPDITVLTWLVEMSRGVEDKEIILSTLTGERIKADCTFLNALIRSKVNGETFQDAKAVLKLFTQYNVVPNRQTYGSLIFCARDPKDAESILNSMENAGFVPGIKTFSLLIGKMPEGFGYKKSLLRRMTNQNVQPDLHFLKVIERHLQRIREKILLEKHKNKNKNNVLEREFEDFNVFYKDWLLKTPIAEEPHQLSNYKKKTEERHWRQMMT
ncbi:pentatricopeptide repeat-containing protein 1, mitochondrial-like [Ylistrum balloti]|uniref:pentatricopeptide repeat-containing protein 1, mitochondrial-like n=1 Tax=Ylistrum balloti TaxID=509963 RepID=UPI002905F4A2|nr:pentatricopeptide repeat-containing protein 1, mitochondrial-like [Ylistrum balloti]